MDLLFCNGYRGRKFKNSKLSIYPNPVTNNEFYISGITKKETIQIYDLNGKLIQVVKM